MIRKLTLQNFKSYASVDPISFPQVSVIVGKNNSGKSSILHALTIPKYAYGEGSPAGPGEDLLHRGSSDGLVRIDYDGPSAGWELKLSTGFPPSAQWDPGVTGADNLVRSTYYLSPLRTPELRFQYLRFQPEVGVNGQQTWNIIHQLRANSDPRYERIVAFLSGMGMGLTGINTPTEQPGFGELRPVSFGNALNLLMNGAGTWSVLPILTQGVLCPPGSTLLVEEPEIHLHQAAINGLWDFFSDCTTRGVQVICTTHSLGLVQSMGQRIDSGALPKNSVAILVERNASGVPGYTAGDPTRDVFTEHLVPQALRKK